MEEIRPSARDARAIPPDDQGLHMSVRVELMPRTLVIWLEHQRPHLGGLADRIAALRVRQRSQCDLLNFAFLWGEACVAHPADIPDAVQIYPLALCAKWYGWNACGTASPASAVSDRSVRAHAKLLGGGSALDPTLEHQSTLLRAQPREYLAGGACRYASARLRPATRCCPTTCAKPRPPSRSATSLPSRHGAPTPPLRGRRSTDAFRLHPRAVDGRVPPGGIMP